VLADFHDGRTVGAQPESVGDGRRLGGVRLERSVVALAVAGRDVREWRHGPLDGAALRVLRSFGGDAARVLGDGAEHRSAEPLAR
jgi:hypothetical protein